MTPTNPPTKRSASPAPARWYARLGARLRRGWHVALLLIPVVSGAEMLLRGRHKVLFFHDILLDYLSTVLIIPAAFVLKVRAWWLFVPLVVVMTVVRLPRWPVSWRTIMSNTLLAVASLSAFVLGTLALVPWLVFAAWFPATAFFTSLAFTGLLIGAWRHGSALARHFGLALAGFSSFLFVAANLLFFFTAQTAPWRQVSSFPAYDVVERDGHYIATTTVKPCSKALLVTGVDRFSPVPGTCTAQRLVKQEGSGDVFLANYSGSPTNEVTRLRGMSAKNLSVPGCTRPIDIALTDDPPMLYVICETSYTLHEVELSSGKTKRKWDLPASPYGLAIDRARGRAYVTSEFFSPRNSVVDLPTGKLLPYIFLGNISWGAEVDEATGHFAIARPLTGEVLFFNAERQVIGRVRTGCAPRDLAIDARRRRMLVSNYLSGNLTVIDLDRLSVVAQLRVGDSGPLRRFRGLDVTDGGAWLAADRSGVWRLPSELVDAL